MRAEDDHCADVAADTVDVVIKRHGSARLVRITETSEVTAVLSLLTQLRRQRESSTPPDAIDGVGSFNLVGRRRTG